MWQGAVSFEALRNVCQSHREGLHGGEGILKVQDVGVAVDAAELHHLQESKNVSVAKLKDLTIP